MNIVSAYSSVGHMMRKARKGLLFNLRTTQVQISMRIHSVWSGQFLFIDIFYSIHWFYKRILNVQISLRKLPIGPFRANCLRDLFCKLPKSPFRAKCLRTLFVKLPKGPFRTNCLRTLFVQTTYGTFSANCIRVLFVHWASYRTFTALLSGQDLCYSFVKIFAFEAPLSGWRHRANRARVWSIVIIKMCEKSDFSVGIPSYNLGWVFSLKSSILPILILFFTFLPQSIFL